MLGGMCGIFGYCNYNKMKGKKEIIDMLCTGLKRLEYRGYDSAGLAVVVKDNYKMYKQTGKVQMLVDHIEKDSKDLTSLPAVPCHVGISHTRWATHGTPSEVNSHPIPSQDQEFFVVHNGIINNWKSLKELLQKHGYVFQSDTDTECISQLILFIHRKCKSRGLQMSFTDLVNETVHKLEGAFAFLVVSKNYPNEVVAARRGSPLLVGVAGPSIVELNCVDVAADCKEPSISIDTPVGTPKVGGSTVDLSRSVSRVFVHGSESPEKSLEVFFSSDSAAIIEHTNRILTLEDGDIAHVSEKGLEINRSIPGGNSFRPLEEVTAELDSIMKGNFPHFMLKEIHEQKDTIINTMRGRVNFEESKVTLGGVTTYLEHIRKARRLVFIACGTSYFACLHMRGLFEELTGIPCVVEIASDFNDRLPPISRADCCVFVSQSGETADSLIALKYIQEKGAISVGVTNVVGSSISRVTDCGIHINAGAEIGVASTKAYTSQSIALAMLAIQIGQDSIHTLERRKQIIADMAKLSDGIAAVLKDEPGLKKISEEYISKQQSILLLGRGYQLATCLEGALKIKEISYIHSEGIGAGELKHGSLALVDEKMCIIMILTDSAQGQSQNAYEQVKSRGGRPLVICTEQTSSLFTNETTQIIVPKVVNCLQGIINVVSLQLIAYYTATALGFNPDFPRNLAKAVTVE
ncbi:glutamine---fructose-6-phosphate transaminase (isomerizing) [Nematocida homosporus]|uniref:glutamine---fructose-6-phosphate transaminase (isomerizing) n=1 Tax=Nematocida homosporus TaxID=1912981 RepID=UPI00222021FB|nr:glutamine---fructose-6-phosphate transaminase (isomerizing) [Nematocida homosporus]KAI5186085.1 glutamine---fructose-6-phosphate transaminase (isomerizing) [Nematocida homosporus]